MNEEATTTAQPLRLQTITVAVDFSPLADRALEYALLLARQFGARLELVHVVAPVPVTAPALAGAVVVPLAGTSPEVVERKKIAVEQLKKLEGRCADKGVRATHFVAESAERSPHISIVELAKENRSDMIVVGTHGRSGLERMLLGSVAEGIVRHASVPVMCVPPLAS